MVTGLSQDRQGCHRTDSAEAGSASRTPSTCLSQESLTNPRQNRVYSLHLAPTPQGVLPQGKNRV